MTDTVSLTCEHCARQFAKPNSLAVHMCEQKRRQHEQHERGVQLGFHAFLRFYEILQGSSRLRTVDDFCKSPYYRAFVKFGRYCYDVNVIKPEKFLEWLLQHNKKIDKWTSDQLYTEYLIDYLLTENVADAMARTIEWSIDWGQKHSAAPHDCLRYGNTNAICHGIVTGHISPWCIYNSPSGQSFLSSLAPEQLNMIWSYIDSDRWHRNFHNRPADQAWAREMLSQAGW